MGFFGVLDTESGMRCDRAMKTTIAMLVGAVLVAGCGPENPIDGSGLLPREGYCIRDGMCARVAGTSGPLVCSDVCIYPPVYDDRCRSYSATDCDPRVQSPEWEGQSPWVFCPPLPGDESLGHTPCPVDWLRE